MSAWVEEEWCNFCGVNPAVGLCSSCQSDEDFANRPDTITCWPSVRRLIASRSPLRIPACNSFRGRTGSRRMLVVRVETIDGVAYFWVRRQTAEMSNAA